MLIPAHGTPTRLRCNYWLHYAEGSAMPPSLLLKLVFQRMRTAPVPFFVKPVARGIADRAERSFIDPQLRLQLEYLEGELGKSACFGGDDFSVADIQLSFSIEALATRGGLDAGYPRVLDFLQRIHARPAYRRALDRGGEFVLGQ